MTTSELLILILGATLTTVLGVASFFMIKWIERVDKSIDELAVETAMLSKQIVKLKDQYTSLGQTIRSEIDEHVAGIRKAPPNFEKLDKIEVQIQGVYSTVHNRIIPSLDAQKDNFGRILVLEGNLQSYEKKLVTMYEVVTKLLKERK